VPLTFEGCWRRTGRSMGTDQPFREAVRALLNERGLTFRALARRTSELDSEGKGLSHSHLAMLGTHDRPTLRAIEVVARALELEPTFFAEYRLGMVRRLFDEDQQGLPGALQNVEALRELVDAQAPAPPAGRLAEMLAPALGRPQRRVRAARRQA
jgi:transcriptional regulator with XRE-family HTH domain